MHPCWRMLMRGGLLGIFALLFHLVPHASVCDHGHDHDDGEDGAPHLHLVCQVGAAAVLIPDAVSMPSTTWVAISRPLPVDDVRPAAVPAEPDPPPNIAA